MLHASLLAGCVTIGDLLDGLSVQVVLDRAVLITGHVPEGESSDSWRGLLERGDLTVVARQR